MNGGRRRRGYRGRQRVEEGGPWDIIVVGAGSAGSALAARLTEDPALKVLLLEAGAASHPYSSIPMSFAFLMNHPTANWRYKSVPEEGTRSEEHTSELQSLMRISYAVFCL